MGQQVVVRISCDAHETLFGKECVIERGIDDDGNGRPPFYHEITVDGIKKIVYMCDDCMARMLAELLAFMDMHGVEPIQRGRSPRAPRDAAPSIPPKVLPKVPQDTALMVATGPNGNGNGKGVPDATFVQAMIDQPVAPATVELPAQAAQPVPVAPKAPSARVKPAGKPKPKGRVEIRRAKGYPCPLCMKPYISTSGVRAHCDHVHGLNIDEIIGTVCHACGNDLGSGKRLASHFGTRHRGDDSQRTILESIVQARKAGDPHGTIKALEDRVAAVHYARTGNGG